MTSTRAALLLALLLGGGAAADPPPEAWVRKVEVRGARQLARHVLLGRIDLKAWRALPADAASTVPAQVAEAYARQGLPAPGVTVTVGPPDAKGATVVTLDLVETPLPRLDSLTADLGGLPFVSSLPTRGKVFWARVDGKFSRYNRRELDLRLRKEQRRLRGLGWKGATFAVSEEAVDGGAARAVSVTLDLGPRESLRGEGIDRPVMRTVRNAWKRRNVPLSEGVVNRLARAAEEGMTERGWVETSVHATQREEDGRRTVVLSATRGPRLAVDEVRFEGAASVPEPELRRALFLHAPRLAGLSKSRPGPAALEADRLALVELHARSGFPDARVEARLEGSGERRTVVFRVEEGLRRTIGSLSFPGATAIGPRELREITGLSEGSLYDAARDAEAAGALRTAWARRGYDEAVVTPRAEGPDDGGRMALAFEVDEGKAYLLGEISVAGNYKTRARRILSLGDGEPGRPLDAVQLAEHQTRLSRLGVFDTVSVTSAPVPGSDPAAKSVVVEVVERSTRYVEYGLDLNTQRGLEVAATFGERNLFGYATSGSVSALAGKKRQSYVVEVGQPALFGTRLFNAVKATYTLDATYDGFTLQTIGAETGLSWEFRPKKVATLVYKVERQTPFDVTPGTGDGPVPTEARIGSLTPTLSLDGRDDPFLTTKGTYLLFRDKVSRRYLGGGVDFDRAELDSRRFYDLGHTITLATTARLGYARAHGSAALPVGERFYVGGGSTHRGFRERQLGPKGLDGTSLGGTSYLLANAELRAPLAGLLEGGLFLDVGNAWEGRIDVSDLRWAAGLGLRLRTPIGPLRVDGGYLLDARPGESRTVFHLAIGHAF